jgi:hypothetical protein
LCFLLHLIHSFIPNVHCQLHLIVTASLILKASQTQVKGLGVSPPLSQFTIRYSHSEGTRVMVAQLHCILSLVSFHLLVYFGILKIVRQVIIYKYVVNIIQVLCGCWLVWEHSCENMNINVKEWCVNIHACAQAYKHSILILRCNLVPWYLEYLFMM